MRTAKRLLAVPAAIGCALAAPAVWAAPYGMDPVPDSVFASRPWDRYGLDGVPAGATSDLGARVDYGEDVIPSAHVPAILDLRHVLPHATLQVLREAIEGGLPTGAAGGP